MMQLEQDVLALMKDKYSKLIVDWNVTDTDEVELLDRDDRILYTISSDDLTKLYNVAEGWTVIK